jgi:protein ImuB
MPKRIVSLWFRYLLADRLLIRRPELQDVPFVFTRTDRGRMVIIEANIVARQAGINPGMLLADARAFVPGLVVIEDTPGRNEKLLKGIAEWCIRYSPIVAIDLPDGLILDASGCTHLWGGEKEYLDEIVSRLKSKGYHAGAAMADTIGAAWAVARFGKAGPIIESGRQVEALLLLPPVALRLEVDLVKSLTKLGFYTIGSFASMPRSVLRRRFGKNLLLKLSQALGQEQEVIVPIQILPPYQERLSSLEPIRTAKGIEIAITNLLEAMCQRLQQEGKGMRAAVLKCYRIDGKIEQVEIGTNRATHMVTHLFKLFEFKISSITPALGIELFVLDGLKVEEVDPVQEALWAERPGLQDDQSVIQLLDRLAGKAGASIISCFVPQEHYWPERSIKSAGIEEKQIFQWSTDELRPTKLLAQPEPIEVAAPIPDDPPILFRYKGDVHYIKKADGPERIEREWWMDSGQHRDYYIVEDEQGQRYWVFRLGHYQNNQSHKWFIHGFFA